MNRSRTECNGKRTKATNSKWTPLSLGCSGAKAAVLVFICSVLLLVCLPSASLTRPIVAAAQNRESENEVAAAKFPKLVAEYLQDLHSRRPAFAAASGLHTWDGQLEDFSSLAIASEISAIKSFQSRLEKIPPLELPLSDAFDHQILASNMSARLLELEQIKNYERNPQVYSDAISNGLLQLAMFEHAPADWRLRQVISKEKMVPRLLDSARMNIRQTPAVFLKVALEVFKGTLSFVQTD